MGRGHNMKTNTQGILQNTGLAICIGLLALTVGAPAQAAPPVERAAYLPVGGTARAPMTDQDHWGVVERWNYPDDGYGDCEDYVLLKRKMLIKAGWPRGALLITVVRDKNGDGHAVLTVKTDRGEYILDNQEAQVLPWYETGLRFVKRQSQSDPNVWVALGDTRPAPTVASSRR